MRAVLLSLLLLAAMLLAGWGRAQEAQEELPPELWVPANDPRKGPRLELVRGPAQCPDEKAFRRMVAVWVDGRDHLAADSPDVVRVRFAWTPQGYVGTVEYTDAAGNTTTQRVTREGNEHCRLLARWVALKVSDHIPDKPPPEPCPTCPSNPACPACPAPAECPMCPPPPKRPWYMDLTVGLSAYGMMTWLLTPNVAPGVGVAAEVRGEWFSVAAEFRVALPSRVIATERVPGASSSFPQPFDLTPVTGLVVPCFRYKYFVGCGVVLAGAFVYQRRDYQDNFATWALGPRLGFEVPFADRFAAFGFGEALFYPARYRLSFTLPPKDDPGGPIANTFWEQPEGAVFFAAGLSVKFK